MSVSPTKYIFVTGGVTSSLGKGIVSASLGKLLMGRGYRVTIQKLDPYINVDPGTMNPYEHGECYVTEDGAETDLDLGHYERFLNTPTSQTNNVTTGKIYQTVINKEREGDLFAELSRTLPGWLVFRASFRHAGPSLEMHRRQVNHLLMGTATAGLEDSQPSGSTV